MTIQSYPDGTISWKFKEYPVLTDKTGSLGVLELSKDFDFPVKRVFFLRGIQENAARGFHAHKDLKQIVICLSGSFNIELDNGYCKERYKMTSDNQCLMIDGRVWREMYDFSEDAVMLVLCDREYKFDEVVRDYDEFKLNVEGLK